MKILKEHEEQAIIAKVVKKIRKEIFEKTTVSQREEEIYNIELPHEEETLSLMNDDFEKIKSSIIEKKKARFCANHKIRGGINSFIRSSSGVSHTLDELQQLQKEVDNIMNEEYDFEMIKSDFIREKQVRFHVKHNTVIKNGVLMGSLVPYPLNKCQQLRKEFDNIVNEKDVKEFENKYVEKCKENERKIKENLDFHNKEYNRILAKYDLMFEKDWNKNKKTYIDEFYKK
jgi:hypothetical protein